MQQQKPVTVASTAEHVLDHTHSALAHKQQEAEESFREWSQRKKRLVREARRHQKELEAEKHKLAVGNNSSRCSSLCAPGGCQPDVHACFFAYDRRRGRRRPGRRIDDG